MSVTCTKLMKSLGYQVINDGKGVCYGLAAMAAYDVLNNYGNAYCERFELQIKSVNKLQLVLYGLHFKKPSTELLAFFDGVCIHTGSRCLPADIYPVLRSPYIPQFENPTRLFFSSDKDLFLLRKFIARFNREHLYQFLGMLRTRINQPFSLIICLEDHAVQIGFDGTGWLAVNHDVNKYHENLQTVLDYLLAGCDRYARNAFWIASVELLGAKGVMQNCIDDLNFIHDKNSIFSENNLESNISMMHIIMTHGYEKYLNDFLSALQDSDYNSDEKLQIIIAKSRRGIPGLFFAMTENYQNIVKLTFDYLMRSKEFSDKQRETVLMCKGSSGPSGFYYLSFRQHVGTFKYFVEAILTSDLDDDSKVNILYPGDTIVNNWLVNTIENNYIDIVKYYAESVLRSSLSFAGKLKLLRTEITPRPLSYAVFKEHYDLLTMYANVVLSFKELNIDEKLSLLSITIPASGSKLEKTINAMVWADDIDEITKVMTMFKSGLNINKVSEVIERCLADRKGW